MMHQTYKLKLAGLALASGLWGLELNTVAQAATVFFGQDQTGATSFSKIAETQFLSNLQQPQTESFESFAPGTSSSLGSPLVLTFGQDTATLIGGGAVRDADFNGLHAIDGKNYWSLTFAEQVRNTYTIAFSTEQAIFGFYATDMGDAGVNAFSVQFNHANGTQSTIAIPHLLGSTDRNELFFGYIDTDRPFTSVTFLANGPIERDGFGLDKLTIGRENTVTYRSAPEPSAIASFFLLGILGFSKWLRLRF